MAGRQGEFPGRQADSIQIQVLVGHKAARARKVVNKQMQVKK